MVTHAGTAHRRSEKLDGFGHRVGQFFGTKELAAHFFHGLVEAGSSVGLPFLVVVAVGDHVVVADHVETVK